MAVLVVKTIFGFIHYTIFCFMKKFMLGLATICMVTGLTAQRPTGGNQGGAAGNVSAATSTGSNDPKMAQFNIPFNPDATVTSEHEATIKGARVPYKTTVGTMPVWDKDGKIEAGVFFTYYERTDVKDKATRPLVISFNGGPGTAALWMQIGYTGPRILNVDDEGYPIQPYGMKDNPHSILDVADIVYVDPVNTGFSRPISKDIPTTRFFGVRADVQYLAEWINTFVTRLNRWA
jgi:carboxypeptidase C (cathepsin A)